MQRRYAPVKDTELGYVSIKPLDHFLWTLFSGFDFIDGYQKEDLVAKMTRNLILIVWAGSERAVRLRP